MVSTLDFDSGSKCSNHLGVTNKFFKRKEFIMKKIKVLFISVITIAACAYSFYIVA